MADATTSSITIGADPEAVMAVIADFAAYPAWADQVKTVEVLEMVKGQSQRAQNGSYTLVGGADTTTVTYSLAVDLNIPMIGMLRRKAEKVIIDTALKGLKRRVEAG